MSMELTICQKCAKVFYGSGRYIACPHCEHVLLDGRSSKRVKKIMDIVFYTNGHPLSGQTIDISESGAKITYNGNLISANTSLKLQINTLTMSRPANVVWSKNVRHLTNLAGLKFL